MVAKLSGALIVLGAVACGNAVATGARSGGAGGADDNRALSTTITRSAL